MTVAIQDQLQTIEVSVLISCIPSIFHIYMKFTIKFTIYLMHQLIFHIVLIKYRILGCIVIDEIIDKYRKYRNIGSFDRDQIVKGHSNNGPKKQQH